MCLGKSTRHGRRRDGGRCGQRCGGGTWLFGVCVPRRRGKELCEREGRGKGEGAVFISGKWRMGVRFHKLAFREGWRKWPDKMRRYSMSIYRDSAIATGLQTLLCRVNTFVTAQEQKVTKNIIFFWGINARHRGRSRLRTGVC